MLVLDRDDEIVRRRLAQKFGFLQQDLVMLEQPSDAELQRFYTENRDVYAEHERRALTHGAVFGAIFVALLPPTIAILRDGIPATFADLSSATGIPVFQFVGNALGAFFKKPGVEAGIFGLILVLVILLEPLGIYGRWVKIRIFFSTFPMYKADSFKRQKTYMKSERLR